MRDIIVIGGGLSGLAAAYALEQRKLPYTLIEVKGHLGGSIASETQQGFLIDKGPFALHKNRDWPWLAELGLQDSLFDVPHWSGNVPMVAFEQGTQSLVDAFVTRLRTGRFLQRMAVSSLGEVEGRYAVCMENGMVIEASALIIASPARYAERMFHSFRPEVSAALRQFHYDRITRVSLGYRAAQIPLPIIEPPDIAFAFGYWTENPQRVPPGHLMIQVGLRWPLEDGKPEDLIAHIQDDMGWPQDALVAQASYWRESHCLNLHDHEHTSLMDQIEADLPPGIVLVGSDYRTLHVQDRVEQGMAAGQQIADWLDSGQ